MQLTQGEGETMFVVCDVLLWLQALMAVGWCTGGLIGVKPIWRAG
jgi:hypothetical protein